MKSKIFITRKIAVLFIVPVSFVSLLFLACKKEAPKIYRWISVKEGVHLRLQPDHRAGKLSLMPYGGKVEFLSEKPEMGKIEGYSGKWTEISWFGQKGWVVSGTLSSVEIDPNKAQPAGAEMTPVEEKPVSVPELEAAAARYYQEYYLNYYKKLQKQFPENYTEDAIKKLLDTIAKRGIKVYTPLGHFAVVNHGAPVGGAQDIDRADAVWVKQAGAWTEILSSWDWGAKMRLGYLNEDNFPEVVILEEVADNVRSAFCLGEHDVALSPLQMGPEFPVVGSMKIKLGKCTETRIEVPDGSGKSMIISFDCKTGRLVKSDPK